MPFQQRHTSGSPVPLWQARGGRTRLRHEWPSLLGKVEAMVSMSDLEDRDLMKLAGHGSADAASELYARHYPRTLQYALALTHDLARAEDLAAEAFANTWRRMREGRAPDSLGAYLASAVRYGLVDEFRRWRRMTGLELEVAIRAGRRGGRIGSQDTTEDLAQSVVDRDLVQRAFAMLTPRHRLILWQTLVEGRDLADVAARLKMNPNAAAALAHRARNAFRRAIAADHGVSPQTRAAAEASHTDAPCSAVPADGRRVVS